MALRVGQLDYLRANAEPSLSVHGLTFSEQKSWTGSVTLLELPDVSVTEQLINGSPAAMAGLYQQVEPHHWRLGGRLRGSLRGEEVAA